MQNNECRHMNRCEALIAILQSVALQEAALARILNAEGEKLQKAVCMSNCLEQLLEVNASVRETIEAASNLEASLRDKTIAVLEEMERCSCCD